MRVARLRRSRRPVRRRARHSLAGRADLRLQPRAVLSPAPPGQAARLDQDPHPRRGPLDRPDRLNAFTVVMGRELASLFAELDADDTVRVVVVTGRGRAFCAGAGAGAIVLASARVTVGWGICALLRLVAPFGAIVRANLRCISWM